MQLFQSRLKLTDAQVTQIVVIYDETRALVDEYYKRSRPELETINKNQQEKILQILNADQRVEYQKILKERELMQEKGKKGGPPGHPPGF
jgi:hypothetical protein